MFRAFMYSAYSFGREVCPMRIHACSFFSLAHLWLASFAVFSSASIGDCSVLGLAVFSGCVCSLDVADVQLWPGELHVGFSVFFFFVVLFLFGVCFCLLALR